MKKRFSQYWQFALTALLLAGFVETAAAEPATIVLKNGKVISGEIVEEAPAHIVLFTDIGEVKVNRSDIERIIYDAFMRFKSDSIAKENENALRDHVVIHLENGDVVDGLLLAKSRAVVMVQTELGRLSIAKNDIRLIEYVSSAYAERGEPVVVALDDGAKVEGYIYHEDHSSLTIMSKLGRLTIDKEKLRSLEYKDIKMPRRLEVRERTRAQPPASAFFGSEPERRRDVIELGYSPRFGSNYSPGFATAYRSRFLLKRFSTFSLNAGANAGFAIYSLDQGAFTAPNVPAAVTATGGAFLTTLGASLPVHFYPKAGSLYEFYFAPILEGHIIYTRLKQTFPSFPLLDSEIVETSFRFGVANRIGIEWRFGRWRAGMNYNIHLIFGEDDFNHFSIHFATKLF